jgi:hypothetical protein
MDRGNCSLLVYESSLWLLILKLLVICENPYGFYKNAHVTYVECNPFF